MAGSRTMWLALVALVSALTAALLTGGSTPVSTLAVAEDPRGAQQVLIGTSTGIWRSTNGGGDWTQVFTGGVGGAPVWMPGVVPKLSRTPGRVASAGPERAGQHNEEIYCGRLGLKRDDLAALARKGIV